MSNDNLPEAVLRTVRVQQLEDARNAIQILIMQRRKLRQALDALVHASLYKDHPEESAYALFILSEIPDND